jgi:hypothetical protein
MKISEVPPGTHMCLIFSDHEAARRDIGTFLAQAVANKGYAQYFASCTRADEVIASVIRCGCKPEQVAAAIEVSPADAVYTPGGVFDKDVMKERLAATYQKHRQNCAGPVHYTGEMEWALRHDEATKKQLVVYEREVNAVCKTHGFSAVCQYDASKFDAEMLIEVMKAHPFLLVDGMVLRSPYFDSDLGA